MGKILIIGAIVLVVWAGLEIQTYGLEGAFNGFFAPAGMEEAARKGVDLAGGKVLAVGYGSGDAAEAIPMRVVDGWEDAALRIGFEAALEDPQNLTRAQYESLHDSGTAEGLQDPDDGFVIESIGNNTNPKLSDEGIEYYRYVS